MSDLMLMRGRSIDFSVAVCPTSRGTGAGKGLQDLADPLHDRDVLVTACGRFCMDRKRINVFAGRGIVIKEGGEGNWFVSLMSCDLAVVDPEQKISQPLDDPLGPRLLLTLGAFCHLSVQAGHQV